MDWLMMASIVAAVAAAALALFANSIEIRDELDSFMSDIHRQGTWTAYAAVAAAIGVLLQAAHYFVTR